MSSQVLADHALSRRLERAEAVANKAFIEARAASTPDSEAEWMEVAGTYAMYDGPHSPCTQTFGLGLFDLPKPADMHLLEAFFRDRGAPVFHEVSPLAGKELLTILGERGYRPVELTSVLFLPLAAYTPVVGEESTPLRVRVVEESESELWARTAAEGWRELTELSGLLLETMLVAARRRSALCFLAEWDGIPIAAGALAIHQGVALLAGASTVPEWRRRGAQRALLRSRLMYAAQAGCDLAMIGAEPGSASQRNAERQGFRIAYTRIKWRLGAS